MNIVGKSIETIRAEIIKGEMFFCTGRGGKRVVLTVEKCDEMIKKYKLKRS